MHVHSRRNRGDLADHHVRHRRRAARALLQASQRPAEPRRVAPASGAVVSSSRAVDRRGDPAVGHDRLCAAGADDGQPFRHAGPAHDRPRRRRDAGVRPPADQGRSARRCRPRSRCARWPIGAPATSARSKPARRRCSGPCSALALQPSTQRYLEVAAAYREAGVRDKAFDYLSEGVRRDPDRRGAARRPGPSLARLGLPRTRPVRRAPRPSTTLPSRPRRATRWAPCCGRWASAPRRDRRSNRPPTSNPLAWYAWRNLCEAAMTRRPDERRHDAVPAGDGAPQGGMWRPHDENREHWPATHRDAAGPAHAGRVRSVVRRRDAAGHQAAAPGRRAERRRARRAPRPALLGPRAGPAPPAHHATCARCRAADWSAARRSSTASPMPAAPAPCSSSSTTATSAWRRCRSASTSATCAPSTSRCRAASRARRCSTRCRTSCSATGSSTSSVRP